MPVEAEGGLIVVASQALPRISFTSRPSFSYVKVSSGSPPLRQPQGSSPLRPSAVNMSQTISAAPRERCLAPIFILGTMRSGTTLMRVILNRHANIEIGPESGFMRAVRNIKAVPNWQFGEGWYERFGLSEVDVNQRIREFYAEIFRQHAARQGKRRWGEKTPFHRFAMREMSEIFPDALFVVMLRHVGAVSMSLKKWKYEVETSIEDWVRSNRKMRKVTSHLDDDRVLWCRYEDLVSSPERTIKQVLHFLDEEFAEELLLPSTTTGDVLEGGTKSGDPIDASRIDRWLNEISDKEEKLVHDLAGSALEEFGYQLKTAMPVGGGVR